MAEKSLLEEVHEEKDLDLVDSIREVVFLLIGGVIGGKAFQTTVANTGIFYDLGVYAGLLIIGVASVYFLHLAPAVGEVLGKRSQGE